MTNKDKREAAIERATNECLAISPSDKPSPVRWGFDAGVEFANRWIPIRSKDDLPDKDGVYWWTRGDRVFKATFSVEDAESDQWPMQCQAWMSFTVPEPYQENNGN